MPTHHEHTCCDHGHTHAHSATQAKSDRTAAAESPHAGIPPGSSRTSFLIDNMDCPTEEALIRSKFAGMPGIGKLDFNLLQRKLSIVHTDQLPQISAALAAIGMNAVLLPASGSQEIRPATALASHKWWLLASAGVAAIAAELLAWFGGNEHGWPVMSLALLAIVISGLGTYKKGWIALINWNLNINALMAIAVTGAVLLRQWPEAAMVMVLFNLAEMIEALTLNRARNAIRSLMALTPEQASVLQADGNWQMQAAASIHVGQTIRVAPGERIPLDGELSKGQSSVNQAPITGESMPVAKRVGDQVFAGTINQTGSFEYLVSALQTDSTIARIIKAVEEAQASKAPTQRFVDQFAAYYTPIVFAIALAVAVVPPLLLGLPWMIWLYKALVLLVIACPCALVVSTPVTVVCGLAAAAKAGILIKGGMYLEQGRELRSIALDKTGTITQGKPVVTDVIMLAATEEFAALRIAALLSERSDHPVSVAIYQHTQQYMQQQTQQHIQQHIQQHSPQFDQDTEPDAVVDFEALPGRGIQARVNTQLHFLGNHRLLEELGLCSPEIEQQLKRLEAEGKSVVVIGHSVNAIAIIAVADTVRASSRQAIAELHKMGIHTVMLSGDNQMTVNAIAQLVGIDEARGGLLPDDKLAALKQQISQYTTVGMVGDGINDAPALACAHIGFAMGAAGSDTALETADVALMDDDLRKIPQFIRLSRQAAAILRQNIVIALGIKAVFFGLACAGIATLWMAVFADMGASLIVVFNGLRLLRWKQAADAEC
ncbi:heavy metal translocating P-type ATPase [Undibacterium sp. Jales W-56]|uniref:heavy metal translocating P-type ATPase n=1 Tax=Undibacterium sp. Jales W-56 TaxID=2897325 RepID=UPI0021CF3E53|nr:heavy metal translocating P-type ATPase [Undibacterium sp. Jales W-56]MCU6432746.1 heavy metal translocating P-type ATPase [Undibacterium sp. Jales W-56]